MVDGQWSIVNASQAMDYGLWTMDYRLFTSYKIASRFLQKKHPVHLC